MNKNKNNTKGHFKLLCNVLILAIWVIIWRRVWNRLWVSGYTQAVPTTAVGSFLGFCRYACLCLKGLCNLSGVLWKKLGHMFFVGLSVLELVSVIELRWNNCFSELCCGYRGKGFKANCWRHTTEDDGHQTFTIAHHEQLVLKLAEKEWAKRTTFY